MGDDLREGKPTLPIIRLLEVGSPQQIELVRHAIETGGGETLGQYGESKNKFLYIVNLAV